MPECAIPRTAESISPGSLSAPGDLNDDGGRDGDNVITYIPKIDRFVWVMQFRRKILAGETKSTATGPNRYRVAVASPKQIIESKGTNWMWFDLTSGLFDFGNDWMDYPDVAVGNKYFYFSANVLGAHSGRLVGRIPLDDLKNGGVIHIGYTGAPLGMAWASHLAQDATSTEYLAGHNDNSMLRVVSFPEASSTYNVHDVAITSWPDDPAKLTSLAPNNVDWLGCPCLPGFSVIGAAVKPGKGSDEVLVAWAAAKGGAFPQPHVDVVRIDTSNYTKLSQKHIWNKTLAYAYPSLAVNSRNDVGIAIAVGGGGSHSNFGVSILGDPYIHLASAPVNASIQRYGDYFTVRRHWPNDALFSAFGLYYTLNNKANPVCGSGSDACSTNLSFIEFGKESALK